jgi:hypothetical protein
LLRGTVVGRTNPSSTVIPNKDRLDNELYLEPEEHEFGMFHLIPLLLIPQPESETHHQGDAVDERMGGSPEPARHVPGSSGQRL